MRSDSPAPRELPFSPLKVDRLSACVYGETLIAECAHRFGVDRLRASVRGETKS